MFRSIAVVIIANWKVFATFLYLGFFAGVFYRAAKGGSVFELNQIGDYLAGVVGPVALFWLVTGYFQQNKAISVQASELKAAVLQHKAQVDATKKIAEQETRKTRIEYYRLVSETSHVIGDCRNELGVRDKTLELLNSVAGLGDLNGFWGRLLSAYSSPYSVLNSTTLSRKKLKRRYEELFSLNQSAQGGLNKVAALDLEELETLFKAAVSLNGDAHVLLKNIKDYNRREERRLATASADREKKKSTLDQSPL